MTVVLTQPCLIHPSTASIIIRSIWSDKHRKREKRTLFIIIIFFNAICCRKNSKMHFFDIIENTQKTSHKFKFLHFACICICAFMHIFKKKDWILINLVRDEMWLLCSSLSLHAFFFRSFNWILNFFLTTVCEQAHTKNETQACINKRQIVIVVHNLNPFPYRIAFSERRNW
jgi:hypothetical protein